MGRVHPTEGSLFSNEAQPSPCEHQDMTQCAAVWGGCRSRRRQPELVPTLFSRSTKGNAEATTQWRTENVLLAHFYALYLWFQQPPQSSFVLQLCLYRSTILFRVLAPGENKTSFERTRRISGLPGWSNHADGGGFIQMAYPKGTKGSKHDTHRLSHSPLPRDTSSPNAETQRLRTAIPSPTIV